MKNEHSRWLTGMILVLMGATGCMVGDEFGEFEDYDAEELVDLEVNEPDLEDYNDTTSIPVIVGDVNWVNTNTLTPGSAEDRVARTVGYLALPAKGVRCTAWLISPRRIVTNNHCVGKAEHAVGARVSFNYVKGVGKSERVWYDCPTLIATWSDIDAAVLRCNRKNNVFPGDEQGFLRLANANPTSADKVYVVHQNCDKYNNPGCAPTKKLSRGKVMNAGYKNVQFTYSADTLGGSSGAPVLASDGTQRHRVVGLHRAGLGGTGDGRGTSNLGRRVSALRARLATIGM